MERLRLSVPSVLLTLALLAFLCNESAAQQQDGATSVAVESNTETPTGQSLVFEIKEQFRSSEAFYLSQEDGYLYFRIATMPRDDKNPNLAVIYSVVWTVPSGNQDPKILPYLVDRTMGYVGSERYEGTARNLVAQTDKIDSRLREFIRQGLRQSSEQE